MKKRRTKQDKQIQAKTFHSVCVQPLCSELLSYHQLAVLCIRPSQFALSLLDRW